MKVSIAHKTTQLPFNFLIESETPEECLLFRIFANWPCNTGKKEKMILTIKNHGGNEDKQTILIGWKESEEDEGKG